MEFYVKTYQDGNERLLAVCDSEIRDEVLIHNGVKIRVKGEFYGSDLYSAHDLLSEIPKSTSINAFGTNICNLLIKEKIIHPATVLWITHGDRKVGHAIVVK